MIAPRLPPTVRVDDLLRFVVAVPTPDADAACAAALPDEVAPISFLALNSKSLLAGLLAVLVFAPGCAASAVFLMRADDRIPPLVAPRLTTPVAMKSDRLPPEHWNPDAVELLLGPKAAARVESAAIFEDPALLAPMLIRGSITINAEELREVADAMAFAPAPKPRRDVRRVRPAKVVAEIAPQPEPPPPTFLEKLFGTRIN